MQGANDDVTDHVGTLAHGRADVGAQVANAEERPSLCLADQHIVSGKRQGFQLLGLQLGSLHAGFDPGEGGQDRLRGVACRGLGALAAGGQANCRSRARGNGGHLHSEASGRLLPGQLGLHWRGDGLGLHGIASWCQKCQLHAAGPLTRVPPRVLEPYKLES